MDDNRILGHFIEEQIVIDLEYADSCDIGRSAQEWMRQEATYHGVDPLEELQAECWRPIAINPIGEDLLAVLFGDC